MLPAARLAVLLSLWIWQVVEVQENGGVGKLAAVCRQVQQLFGGARHWADVHVPHLLRRVQLQQLLFDLQVLLNVPAFVLELQDGFGVAVDGGDWGRHASCEGAPRQTIKQKWIQYFSPHYSFKYMSFKYENWISDFVFLNKEQIFKIYSQNIRLHC